MRLSDVNRNVNFAGYKNVIHNNINRNDLSYTLLSMQLNDEGAKDLTEFNNIMRLQDKKTDTDVLTVFYAEKSKIPGFLFLNDRSMFLGDELRTLWEKYNSSTAYKKEEKASLKAYTLLASITNRMMQNGLTTMDKSFPDVVRKTVMNLKNIFTASPMAVFGLVQQSILENKSLEETAAILNNVVKHNMQIFFK